MLLSDCVVIRLVDHFPREQHSAADYNCSRMPCNGISCRITRRIICIGITCNSITCNMIDSLHLDNILHLTTKSLQFLVDKVPSVDKFRASIHNPPLSPSARGPFDPLLQIPVLIHATATNSKHHSF